MSYSKSKSGDIISYVIERNITSNSREGVSCGEEANLMMSSGDTNSDISSSELVNFQFN